jgi:Type II secretion system (T2SS), protein E, N-terminal domain
MRKKIGELLIESGAVSQDQVRTALGQQRAYGRGQRLGSVLMTLGFASPTAVARALARQVDLPFVELPEIPPEVGSLVALDFQEEHRLVPFRLEKEGRSERLHVAVDDPSDLTVVDELRFQLNKSIRVHVAAADDLDRALTLARGEELEVVSGVELPPPPPEAAVVSSLLDWDLPPPPPDEEDDDGDITLITPRSALKQKPLAPPAPPPFDEDDDDITLITPKAALKPKPGAAARPPPPPRDSEDLLEELLGEPEPEASDEAGKPIVPVVRFGGAAQGLPPPPPTPELPDISEDDLKVLEDIERMADGAEATLHTEKVKPARMVASLIRLLIRKRVIREEEFLEELSRK